MLIPIGHDHTLRRQPVVTYAIMAICLAVQVYATTVEPDEGEIEQLLAEHDAASTPEEAEEVEARLVHLVERVPAMRWGYQTDEHPGANLVLSAFVHEGWLHLIGNMLFLWLAGSALEDRWGRGRFLAFYLVGAAAATLAFDLSYHGPPTVLVGASGAISAALGAFLICFHSARIRMAYWIFFRVGTFQIPAWVALLLWFAEQLISVGLEPESGVTQVAYGAHIGGFLFGVAIAVIGRAMAGSATAADGDGDAARVPPATTHRRAYRWPDASARARAAARPRGDAAATRPPPSAAPPSAAPPSRPATSAADEPARPDAPGGPRFLK